MSEEGRKDDEGKLRYDLLPVGPLETLVAVYNFGAKRYSDNNWRKGISWGRIFGAINRHLWAFWRGEDLDKESGLPHLAHAAWGCLTLMEYMKNRPDLDDRWSTTSQLKRFIGSVKATIEEDYYKAIQNQRNALTNMGNGL